MLFLQMGFNLVEFRDVEIPSPALVAIENGKWNVEMRSYTVHILASIDWFGRDVRFYFVSCSHPYF